jgi:iron(II)-dependent oxidoreductase
MTLMSDDAVSLEGDPGEIVTGDDGSSSVTLTSFGGSSEAGFTASPMIDGLFHGMMPMVPTVTYEFLDVASGNAFDLDNSPMVKVEGAAFSLGATDGDDLRQDDEVPAVEVTVPSFYIDKHEVTNAQYNRFLAETGYRGESKYGYVEELMADDLPVIGITWRDAKAYAMWAGKRLPNEAEWELAAGGVKQAIYPWGNEFDASKCVNAETASMTAPAGTMSGSGPSGALNMAGNVWEWTADAYDWELTQKQTSGEMYVSPDVAPDLASVRGGSYKSGPADLRTSNRLGMNPKAQTDDIGFRCARDANE